MANLKLEVSVPLSGRLPALDELKGLAILLILLYHAGGVLIWQNFLHGDVGVDLFFILSGAGLALGARPETAAQFFGRRLRRIMPAYWVTLTLFLICNTHYLELNYSFANIATHYLGLHGLFGDGFAFAVNDSFWFITAILFAYSCYWILRRWIAQPDRYLLAAGLICTGVAFWLFFTGQSGLVGHFGFRLPGFFGGVLLGHLLRTGQLSLPLTPAFGLALVVLAYVPYVCGMIFFPPIVGFALIAGYVFALRPRLADDSGILKVLRFLGDHSLEIFLLHQPLIRSYNYYLHGRWLNVPTPSELSLIVGMAIGLTVTLLASVELRRALSKISFLK